MKSNIFKGVLLSSLLISLIAVVGCYIQVSGYNFPLAKYERTVRLSKPMEAGSEFTANSKDGWINVRGGDIADCNVTATIVVRADSDENARRIAEQTNLKLEQFGNKLTLKVDKPLMMMNQSVDVHIDAMVQKNCDLNLDTDDGGITIENVNGRINIKTDDGKVTLSRVGGEIKVRCKDSLVKVQEVTGDVDLQSDDGRMIVEYSKDAGGACNVLLVTDDGAVDFTAPANFSADVEITTDDGSINTSLPINVIGKIGKREVRGTIGAGEGKLCIKTDDGSVRIK